MRSTDARAKRLAASVVQAWEQLSAKRGKQYRAILEKRYAAPSVRQFMLHNLECAKGEKVSWGEIYIAYRAWCFVQGVYLPPIGVEAFGKEFGAACEKAGIQIEGDQKLYAVGVRLG